MTLLWPSMYSSRHTTHSVCFPAYLFFFGGVAGFSLEGDAFVAGFPGGEDAASSMTDVVLDLGRDRDIIDCGLLWRSGVSGEAAVGDTTCADDELEEADIV